VGGGEARSRKSMEGMVAVPRAAMRGISWRRAWRRRWKEVVRASRWGARRVALRVAKRGARGYGEGAGGYGEGSAGQWSGHGGAVLGVNAGWWWWWWEARVSLRVCLCLLGKDGAMWFLTWTPRHGTRHDHLSKVILRI
ncbi:hypothetical protein Tdes44962_MAKER09944, partial [Teratosphaeria destructans]